MRKWLEESDWMDAYRMEAAEEAEEVPAPVTTAGRASVEALRAKVRWVVSHANHLPPDTL
jgi:hypothetical protein